MARTMEFSEGDVLMGQGDDDTAAYLIQDGWLQVRHKTASGALATSTLGPGEIVGELGLAGIVKQRTATVTALTDGLVEIIDRGALIRLVNGPGNRLVPLLAALFSRLQDSLIEEPELDDTMVMHARVEGLNDKAMRALCNQPRMITRLPWVFGAYSGPASVTDLFQARTRVDVKLAGEGRAIRACHVQIEVAEEKGLQLHLMNHGDFCELNGERIGYGNVSTIVPLPVGEHILTFGQSTDPYRFSIRVLS